MHEDDSQTERDLKNAKNGLGVEQGFEDELENNIQREQTHTRKGGEWSNELAVYLTLQLHAQEAFWNTNVGLWLVNSLRKCYTQMHSGCHMNYSSPTVCRGFGKQQQDFKVGLKDDRMSTWIKDATNATKKSSGLQTQTQPSVMGMKDKWKRELLSQCPE